MRAMVLIGMTLGAALATGGCHSKNRTPSDAGTRMDAGRDAAVPTSTLTGIDPTAGSGEATSASYLIRLNVSSPEPIGTTSSTNYSVSFGPRAPR